MFRDLNNPYVNQLMNRYIECPQGNAFMALCDDNKNIIFCGSITCDFNLNLPPCIKLNINDFNLKPYDDDCKRHNIKNYKKNCDLEVEIISNNSICLKLVFLEEYSSQNPNGYLEEYSSKYPIGFSIQICELFRIAKFIFKVDQIDDTDINNMIISLESGPFLSSSSSDNSLYVSSSVIYM